MLVWHLRGGVDDLPRCPLSSIRSALHTSQGLTNPLFAKPGYPAIGDERDGTQARAQAEPVTHWQWVLDMGYKPLNYACPLFARKFESAAKKKVRQMGLSCEGVGLSPACLWLASP